MGAYMLKMVMKFFFFPLPRSEPRNVDWMEPLLSFVPPKIFRLDALSAEYERPKEALCPGACLVSYLSLYFLAR